MGQVRQKNLSFSAQALIFKTKMKTPALKYELYTSIRGKHIKHTNIQKHVLLPDRI